MKAHRTLCLAALLLAGTGLSLLAGQAHLKSKALLADWLIDRAYSGYLFDGRAHRPWAWADTHPIARIEVPRLGLRRTILAGASGSSLAFGLGHVSGTAFPGERGNCAIAGHRDSIGA